MPKTARPPSHDGGRDQTSNWVKLASMFVGQKLDGWAATGALVAAAITAGSALVVLFLIHHH
jgi:hypothetical protein